MLEQLKEQVYQANMLLPAHHLVTFTWGNVSGIDRESGIMAIKPSGVEYDQLSPEDMVLVDIRTGKKVEGKWNPSSDTDTHCELYRSFENIGGVVHTHSRWATIFSQMGRGVPALGSTSWKPARSLWRPSRARAPTTSPRCWCTATGPSPGAPTP